MNPKDIKILIVDDEEDMRTVLSAFFSEFGFDTETASSGNEALEKMQKNPAHVVISDIVMPDGDGYFLLEALREKYFLQPRFFFISGNVKMDPEEAFARGADGFFSKPFDVNEVKKMITKAFLSPSIRWGSPVRSTDYLVKKRFENFEKLELGQEVGFGREGLFIQQNYDIPEVGSSVMFEFELLDREPLWKIRGAGRTVWRREDRVGSLATGFGLQIISLEPQTLEFYLEYIQRKKILSLVPKKAN